MRPTTKKTTIVRRDFLKICGSALGLALAQSAREPAHAAAQTVRLVDAVGSDPQAEFGGRLYRGTVDGCILVSLDAGKTWQQQTVLHRGCAVTRLTASAQGMVARLEFQGHLFELTTPDGKSWRYK